MTSSKIIARAVAFIATLILAPIGDLQAAEPAHLTMKPLHSISFDVGTERTSGYFIAENGVCKLVVTVAGEPDWSEVQSLTVTRFEASVAAEKAVRYQSEAGKTFEFTCKAGATAMNVSDIEQIASNSDH